MDENQQTSQQNPAMNPAPPKQDVSFPSNAKKKSKSKKWIFLVVIIILIGGGAGLFFLGRSREGGQEASPTPEPLVQGTLFTPFPEATNDPSPSPKAADRDSVSIMVLNGTGIPREASYLQGQLGNLGYSDVDAGNSSSQDNTATSVTFDTALSDTLIAEITEKLEELYKNVTVKTSSSLDVDVRITTGLRKGATAKPSSTPVPATPAASESPSPTPTLDPSASPVN